MVVESVAAAGDDEGAGTTALHCKASALRLPVLQPVHAPLPPAHWLQPPTLAEQQNWPRQAEEKQSEATEQERPAGRPQASLPRLTE